MTVTETGVPSCVLVLPEAIRRQVLEHLLGALPNEGVGLLAVEWIHRGEVLLADSRKFYPGTNVRASPTRFELDPRELIAALQDIDRNDWSLGAIVHSHPAGEASPSRTDLGEANYPESLMVIVSLAGLTPDLQAWRLERQSEQYTPISVPIVAFWPD